MELCEVLYSKKYTSWGELEKAIEALDLTVDKGNAFEQFCFLFVSCIQYLVYRNRHGLTSFLYKKTYKNAVW